MKTTTHDIHPAILADMDNNPADPLKWWIAIGSNHGWGRSDKSMAEAIRFMNKNSETKASEFDVYRCTPNTTCNERGNLTFPLGDTPPVKVRSVRKIRNAKTGELVTRAEVAARFE